MRDPYRRCPKSGTSEPHERHDRGPTDSGKPTMTADSESVAKHAALHPVHLDEQMSVTQLVQRLETLHFDSHEEARVMIDPGVQAFLIPRPKPPPLIISMRKFATCGARSDRDERSALPTT